jgi:predicted nucleic acid-binding protein
MVSRGMPDLGLGLADCSVIVLAERYETRRLCSFDDSLEASNFESWRVDRLGTKSG